MNFANLGKIIDPGQGDWSRAILSTPYRAHC